MSNNLTKLNIAVEEVEALIEMLESDRQLNQMTESAKEYSKGIEVELEQLLENITN